MDLDQLLTRRTQRLDRGGLRPASPECLSFVVLGDLAQGDGPSAESRDHLAVCERCRRVLRGLQRARDADETSDEFTWTTGQPTPPIRVRGWWRRIGVAGAAAAVVFAGTLWWREQEVERLQQEFESLRSRVRAQVDRIERDALAVRENASAAAQLLGAPADGAIGPEAYRDLLFRTLDGFSEPMQRLEELRRQLAPPDRAAGVPE